MEGASSRSIIEPSVFFFWRLLGLIPGGTPFSQLNKGVRDAMSATTKRDVEHQVSQKHQFLSHLDYGSKSYDLGLYGTSMSGICYLSRSSTERHRDFSESAVFHVAS